jgi:hypothetical protein
MRVFIHSLVAVLLVPVAQEDTSRPAPTGLSCSARDAPHWTLLLDENRAWLVVPPGRGVNLEGRFSLDGSTSFGWRGRSTGGGRDLVAFVSETACTMSSTEEQSFAVRVSLPDGRFVSGCCQRVGDTSAEEAQAALRPRPSPAPTPAPALGDWISSLTTFHPAIRECVGELSKAEAVVFAAVKPDKTTHLVLRLPEDRYADCLLPPGRGPAQVSLRPPDTPTSAEERAAILSLLPTPPPMEPCYRPQAVFDENGERLGWIALKGC